MSLITLLVTVLLTAVQGTVLEELVSMVEEEVQDRQCRQDVLTLVREFQNATDWAMHMVDATAKLPSGILEGNTRLLGHFDQCVTSHGGGIRGQYCLANLQASPAGPVWEKIFDKATVGRRYLETTRGCNKLIRAIPLASLMEWAVCVPDSCHANEIQSLLNAALRRLALPLEAQVLPEYCQVERATWLQFTRGDCVMIFILGLILVVVTAGSCYDYYLNRKGFKYHPGNFEKILLAFSMPANWKKLVSSKSSCEDLGCISGLRAICAVGAVLIHKIVYVAICPVANKKELYQTIHSTYWLPVYVGLMTVDTFLTISGLLRGRRIIGELENGRFQYFRSALQRYLRLSPPYFMTIAFSATLLDNLGSGPYWRKDLHVNSEYCSNNWLFNILYVSNYMKSEFSCLIQSWSSSADFQMSLLAPLIITVVCRSRLAGKALFAVIVALSAAIPVISILLHHSTGAYLFTSSDQQINDYLKDIYFPTHNRMAPYLVGLGMGVVLHRLRDHKVHISKFWVAVGWVYSTSMLLVIPYNIALLNTSSSLIQQAIVGGLHRFLWSVGLAWFVFACHTGHGGIINNVLNSTALRFVGRISFCIYLTHMAILDLSISRVRSPVWSDQFSMYHSFFGDMVITIVVSIVLHLVCEAPSLNIIRIFFQQDEIVEKIEDNECQGIQETKNHIHGNSVYDRENDSQFVRHRIPRFTADS